MAWANSAGAPSEIGWSLLAFLTVKACAGPWNPWGRQPPTACSNSTQLGFANEPEAWWRTTRPLPSSRIALRKLALLASDQVVSGLSLADLKLR